jgi:hypothetical protein
MICPPYWSSPGDEAGTRGLVTISAHGWGRDLRSAGWGGYGVESYGQWVRDRGKSSEKKKSFGNVRLEEKIKTNRDF